MKRLSASVATFFVALPTIMLFNQALFYGGCFKAHCLEAASGKVLIVSLILSGIVYAIAGKPEADNSSAITPKPRSKGPEYWSEKSGPEVNLYREWKDANRQQSYGGWIYVFNIPDRNLFKIGMAAHAPWQRMIQYCEKHSLKPNPNSLRKYKVPSHLKTGLVEEHIHSYIRLQGYQKPEGIAAAEVFSHPGDYPTVVGHVVRAFEQAID